MEQYKFAKIVSTENGIRLNCTIKADLDSLVIQLKQFYPKMRFEETYKLPSGEIYGYLIKGFSSNNDDVRWWMIKYLCSQGWEPFDIASVVNSGFDGEIKTVFHYHFRHRDSI